MSESPQKKKYRTYSGDLDKARKSAINQYAEQVIARKNDNSGKVPQGLYKELAESDLAKRLDITIDHITYRVRTLQAAEKKRLEAEAQGLRDRIELAALRERERTATEALVSLQGGGNDEAGEASSGGNDQEAPGGGNDVPEEAHGGGNDQEASSDGNDVVGEAGGGNDQEAPNDGNDEIEICCFPCCLAAKNKRQYNFRSCSSCDEQYHGKCLAAWEFETEFDGEDCEICYGCHRDANTEFYERYDKDHPPVPESNNQDDSTNEQMEEDSSSEEEPVRNRGGRPKGTTNVKKAAQKRAKVDATNRVVTLYFEAKTEAQKNGTIVAPGTRQRLVREAKEHFGIEDDSFDVKKTLIHNRITRGQLVVSHRGVTAPLASPEVILVSYIITAANIGAPLSVSECILVMTRMIAGTIWEQVYRDYKKKHKIDDPNGPLLGPGWYKGFFRRNKELIEAKTAQPFEQNRGNHINNSSFVKMYRNWYAAMVESGNATRLDAPVHMDSDGNVVQEESAAFGYQVEYQLERPDNVFVYDETGGDTSSKNDKNSGGERRLVGRGMVPRVMGGTKGCHFTVVPVNNLKGELVMLTIIFPGEQMLASYVLGIDILAEGASQALESDSDRYEFQFGRGKLFPGGTSCFVGEKEVPCLCACSPKGSMTDSILKQMFSKLDELGITTRDPDNNVFPMMIMDGHISRMGLDFLVYVNDEKTKWMPMLGVPYGTSIWQFHDHELMNRLFKQYYYKWKADRILKKRAIGLSGDIEREEIILLVGEAAERSFARIDNAIRTLSLIGLNPLNRNCLDHPMVLETAPVEVRENRVRILESRGITYSGNPSLLPASMRDLTETGSGRLVDNAAIANAVETLDHSGAITQNIMTLAVAADRRNAGRQRNNAQEPSNLTEVLGKARRLTANVVFGQGDGRLGPEVRDDVQRRNDQTVAMAEAKVERKKSRNRKLQKKVRSIRAKLRKKGGEMSKLTIPDLKTLCQWKKDTKNSRKLIAITKLKTKAELIDRYNSTRHNQSPCVSRENSSAEEDDNESNGDEEVEYDEEAEEVAEEEEQAEEEEAEDDEAIDDDEE